MTEFIAMEGRSGQDPPRPSLPDADVHLWHARLEGGDLVLDDAGRLLSADEIARAERFRRPADARRFLAARLVLRRLLGLYLGLPPRALRFAYDEHGKPRLRDEEGETLEFGVAHSEGVALYAVTRGRQVGVDLELMRAEIASSEIARQFFTREECDLLCAAPPVERSQTFYRLWTLKEAYLKARGAGLSLPLDSFAVSLGGGGAAALSWDRLHPQDVGRWAFLELDLGPGWAAALVVEGTPRIGKLWAWN